MDDAAVLANLWTMVIRFGEYVNRYGWCDPTSGMPILPADEFDGILAFYDPVAWRPVIDGIEDH